MDLLIVFLSITGVIFIITMLIITIPAHRNNLKRLKAEQETREIMKRLELGDMVVGDLTDDSLWKIANFSISHMPVAPSTELWRLAKDELNSRRRDKLLNHP